MQAYSNPKHESDPTALPDVAARFRCNQCEALMINGVFCHETGCPNRNARYDSELSEWIKQRKCFECGCTVDADDLCCNNPANYGDEGDAGDESPEWS